MSEDRIAYLKSLAEAYGVDFLIVWELAQLLGPQEDKDGLIVALEDYS